MPNLKISFNVKPKTGPWGGGNLFIENLKKFFRIKWSPSCISPIRF